MPSPSTTTKRDATTKSPASNINPRKAANKAVVGSEKTESAGNVTSTRKEDVKPATIKKSTTVPSTTSQTKEITPDTSSTLNKPRRKPRKLNQEPRADPRPDSKVAALSASASNEELDALKSRVRGLEAKVEQLYKTAIDARSARSPRRRGKGRKGSSTTVDPNAATSASHVTRIEDLDDDEDESEEADNELIQLESELEVARQDLDSYLPRTRRTPSEEIDHIEEIPRDEQFARRTSERQVTFSGSYRIPIPTNVSVEDVKNIKSGVSAAQNIARTFLEQRRAAAAPNADQNLPTASQPPPRTSAPGKSKAAPSMVSVAIDNSGDKQSWGDWIGGYSMAITRAVKNIEHEAAVESQRGGTPSRGVSVQAEGVNSLPATKKSSSRRPPARAKISSEQVHGLMS